MSGTSLDGLDLALCEFEEIQGKWRSKILDAQTFQYSKDWKNALANAHLSSAFDFCVLHVAFGKFIGEKVLAFSAGKDFDLVASHGHTVFHTPNENGISVQIGDGNSIRAVAGKPVVWDFRQQDVTLGGNGAPLVPVGEKFLYPEFDTFLNLGGIANISVHDSDEVIGFDVAPCNMVLNYFAMRLNMEYDANGEVAKNGEFVAELFEWWNNQGFYELKYPKSLGREWVEEMLKETSLNFPHLKEEDLMHTYCHHLAFQISRVLKIETERVLVTGGGAYHAFLVEMLKKYSPTVIFKLPEPKEIEFKEAKIFAFLGLLRSLGQENVFKQVTGASENSISGAMTA